MEIFETIQIVYGVIIMAVFIIVCALFFYVNVFEKDENQKVGPLKSCWWFILSILAVIGCFMLLGLCSREGEWEPRHTYIQKPMQNNVNEVNISFTLFSNT